MKRFSLRCSQISPKINRLVSVRGHEVSKTAFFERNSFSMITSVFEMIERCFCHHRVFLVKTHRNMYSITLKGQGVNIWPQVKVTWWPKYVILHMHRSVLMRQTQWDHSHVSISAKSKVIRKKTVGELVTSDDLRWPLEGRRWKLSPGPSLRTYANTIPSEWKCSAWAGHEIDLASGHEYT